MTNDFLVWGREVVNEAAARLEQSIPGAARGSESHLDGYEALYVHFRDAHLPQDLAVWLYAAREGSANNVAGFRDAIGVGLKHNADAELDVDAWSFRRLTPFAWRRHVDTRYEGFRWLQNADQLPSDSKQAAAAIVERVLRALQRCRAIK
ncbi:MAG: hypothetical protein ACXVRH_01570 [Thermoleophilaceae bacterium]